VTNETALVERIHRRLLELPDLAERDLLPDVTELAIEAAPLAQPSDHDALVRQVLARVRGLGPIEPLLADQSVSEVMVNGAGPVWVEREGVLAETDVVLGPADVDRLVERVVAPMGRRVDLRSPTVDGRLPDGSRVNVVVAPVALDGPYITIRRFVLRDVDVSEFAPPVVGELLKLLIARGSNVVVSGGTGAGKTTLLNALVRLADPGERIITIEDAAELRLPHPHVVRLEARPESAEGGDGVSIRRLVRNALRMRPDRIVLGEVRGPEALDLVQALNTGHAGCLSTVHANGPLDALRRIETLAMSAGDGVPHVAIRDQVVAAVDLVVHVGRIGSARQIIEISEVAGPDSVRTVVIDGRVTADLLRPARRVRTGGGS
jgi:pilus assembly protein CpaF